MQCRGFCQKSSCVKASDHVHIQRSSSLERVGLKPEQMNKMVDTENFCFKNLRADESKLASGTNDVTKNNVFGKEGMLPISLNENEGGRPAEARKEDSSDTDIEGLGLLNLRSSKQLMPLLLTFEHSDFRTIVEEVQNGIGLDHVYQGHEASVPLGADQDLQQLEGSIKLCDLHKRISVLPYPLQTFSSGSGRPDLEEFDEQFNLSEDIVKDRSLPCDVITKNRMLTNGLPVQLSGKEPYFASIASGLKSQGRIDHQGYILKGNESLSSIYQQKVQVVSTHLTCFMCEGRNLLLNGWPTLAEALETLDLEYRQQPFSEEELSGERSNQESWKGLNIHLKSQKPLYWEEEEQEDLGPDERFRYLENVDLNETYVDTVLDMEDVLLNSDESGSRGRFLMATRNSVIGAPRFSRDGNLSSSTSGLQLFASNTRGLSLCNPFTLDWAEVVGAKQRKGSSSFGERIVGVKDYTVYCIQVSSGSLKWEVLRRYRDFVDLYHQLRRKFNARTERTLPSLWKEVESESRKACGNTTPNVIEVRSSRIEKCLQSLLQAGPPFSTSSSLYWFLHPSGFEDLQSIASPILQKGSDVQLGALALPHLQSPWSEIRCSEGGLHHDKSPSTLGKTIKLVLKIHPNKNIKQLLSAQHHSCVGCDKHLDVEKGLVRGFVQNLGRGKPRLCEYSGQLFCASCHLNETAVLPGQVLLHWDFTPRRVSQFAKAYLDSIYDQPMLCVSAVNPYLYLRVPILAHVKEARRKLSKMLSCVHCPSHAQIQQMMASRRYLLEDNDFFAMQDLEDLSKGPLAVLPGLLTAVLESLRVHITKQCSICQDTGEWCGAGILCEDPFSAIFPFQEENITRCKVCHVPFHEVCISECSSCPSCPKNWSKKAGHAAESIGSDQKEELHDDHSDVLQFLDGQVTALVNKTIDGSASSSSLAGPKLQGLAESEKQPQTRRNWPSLYNLLSKRRLW